MKLYTHLSLLAFLSFTTLNGNATFGASYQLGKKFCQSPAGTVAFGALEFVVHKAGTLMPASKADARAYGIMAKALSYGPVKELYDQAAQAPSCSGVTGKYKLKLMQATESGFAAECHTIAREVRVRDDLPDERALALFIYELINAKNFQKLCHLRDQCRSHAIDVEQFAKGAEKVEYENAIEHLALIERSGLGHQYIVWRDFKDFEVVWEQEIKNSSHADYWRKQGKAFAR